MISRIKQLLEMQQLTPTQFADRIGVGRPVVSHILNERNKPSLDVARSIKAAFPDLSYDWLLEGTGNMLATSPTGSESAAAAPARPTAPPAIAAPVATPVFPVAAPRLQQAKPLPNSPARFIKASAGLSAATPAATPTQELAPAPIPEAPVVPRVAESQTVASQLIEEEQKVPSAVEPPLPTPTIPATVVEAAALMAEPGKAIRRIVIFYRDGSFADYQPEG